MDEHVCVAAENVLGSAVLEQRLGSASKAAPGQSKHTGSYSWPNQIDVRFCPSSAPHFHMNAEYAKAKKKEKKREIYKILVPWSHCRENRFAGRSLHASLLQITGIVAS